MREKYLLTVEKVTKEKLNENHEIKLYETFECEEEVVYFLDDELIEKLEELDLKIQEVEVLVYKLDENNRAVLYSKYNHKVNTGMLALYFDKEEFIEKEDQRWDLIETLMEERRVVKDKKHYMLILVKDEIKNGNIERKIIEKYEPKTEEYLMALLKGSIENVVLNGRINTMLFEKPEQTKAFLYEWRGEDYRGFVEYSGYIKATKREELDDFFFNKKEINPTSTLFYFVNEMYDKKDENQVGRYLIFLGKNIKDKNNEGEISEIKIFDDKRELMKYLLEDATKYFLDGEFGEEEYESNIRLYDRYSDDRLVEYMSFSPNKNANEIEDFFMCSYIDYVGEFKLYEFLKNHITR